MNRGRFLAFGIGSALIALLVAASAWFLARPPLARAPGGPPPGFAIPVEAQPVRIGVARREAEAIGTLRSWESVVIRPEISGRVVKINFEEGQLANRGAVLVELDPAEAEAEVTRAKAAAELARQTYERARKLRQDGAGTAASLDRAQAELASAEAAVKLADARLEKTRLVAPFNGVLGLRKASIGALLMPGAEIVNLEQIDQLKVDFRVPERLLAAVKVDQTIRVAVDALGKKSVEGAVYAIDPQLETGGRSIVLRARIPNPDGVLRPGLFARVVLTLEQRHDAIFVPEQAILPGSDGTPFVFKAAGGKAAMTAVALGERLKGEVEIVRGLAAGDVVVTAGLLKLFGNPPPDVCLLPTGGATAAPTAGAPPGPGSAPTARPAEPAPAALPACKPPPGK